MKVLAVHNYYQQLGGEDTIFATEADLLESNGHQVYCYTVHNDRVNGMGAIALTKNTLWNSDVYRELRSLIQKERPHVAHFHNTFPVISPAAYYAAKDEGVPVVQTLHNYRLLCPNGLFFRGGQVCEDCIGKSFPFPGIIHGCYRNSHVASAGVASMVKFHDLRGTWTNAVDVFIAYSQFALHKFIEGGLPKEKFQFKTNFLHPAPTPGNGSGGYALFVGRLSPEKGLDTVLEAWETLGTKIPLKIAGDGPLAPMVKTAAEKGKGVEWLGRRSLSDIYDLMGEAMFLVFSSEWYETFGRVAIESFAKGTPVIGANIGAIAELVAPMKTGLHFQPGHTASLIEQVEWALAHPDAMQQMRINARSEFEEKYTAHSNYKRMMEIYHLVCT
ncbi:glycosyltransferase [Lyngbya confervoides]|uniref:Glycosyltransferase n=1 Tax=Lyngbya confervoides BDU141951 TaxID=1574623 RepID=A0ABD4T8I6_9CYAN|nr:glycosyltransferase [Lyngbya confervoides]MCM1984896.1 glycosyltransferase [Lyngbya confervoides BDU141951]